MNTILEEGYIMLSTEWCWDTMLAMEHNDVTAQHNVDNGTQWHGVISQKFLIKYYEYFFDYPTIIMNQLTIKAYT